MTALFMVTRDPFLPWKHTERVLREAERRGFETFVALDNRSSDEDFEHIRALVNKVAPFKSEGSCESAFRLVQAIEEDFFFRVDDDEIHLAAAQNLLADFRAQGDFQLESLIVQHTSDFVGGVLAVAKNKNSPALHAHLWK